MSILTTQNITSSASIGLTTELVYIDGSGGPFTVTLPVIGALNHGRYLIIRRWDNTASVQCTLTTSGTNTIGNTAPYNQTTWPLNSEGCWQITANNSNGRWEMLYNSPGLYLP